MFILLLLKITGNESMRLITYQSILEMEDFRIFNCFTQIHTCGFHTILDNVMLVKLIDRIYLI